MVIAALLACDTRNSQLTFLPKLAGEGYEVVFEAFPVGQGQAAFGDEDGRGGNEAEFHIVVLYDHLDAFADRVDRSAPVDIKSDGAGVQHDLYTMLYVAVIHADPAHFLHQLPGFEAEDACNGYTADHQRGYRRGVLPGIGEIHENGGNGDQNKQYKVSGSRPVVE